MKKLSALLAWVSPQRLLAAASLFTVGGLVFMVAPSFVESPLFLMASLSLAHALGLTGVLLFGTAILQEVLTGPRSAPVSRRASNQPAAGDGQASGRPSD